jgi:hypothetical protein
VQQTDYIEMSLPDKPSAGSFALALLAPLDEENHQDHRFADCRIHNSYTVLSE